VYKWEIFKSGNSTAIVELSDPTYSLGCSKDSNGDLICSSDLGNYNKKKYIK
jgi:hypothetical protein